MSKVKINGKDYTVPELTFRHLPMMEKCGLTLKDMTSSRYIFTTVEVFTAIVCEWEIEQADYLLEQHILGGGNVLTIYDAFMDAMRDSGFFKTLLERGEKKKALAENKNN